MSQPLSLQQVTDKLAHLEQLMDAVREEVAELRRQMEPALQPQMTKTETAIAYPWIDKSLQKYWVTEIFNMLSIQDERIDIEELQRRMSQVGLNDNELSQDLLRMREE